jgi:hypothetical protein
VYSKGIPRESETAMTDLGLTRDDRTMTFVVTTTEKVTSFRGTSFVPNFCTAKIESGKVVSVGLDRLDENGWGIDDPAGPDGAELNVSYSGGEIVGPTRANLPQVARDALAAIEKAIA